MLGILRQGLALLGAESAEKGGRRCLPFQEKVQENESCIDVYHNKQTPRILFSRGARRNLIITY